MHTIRYGPWPGQEADLHLPATSRPPVVCLLHGGFWRMPYGRDQLTAVADGLASTGLAAWNLEYRRVGAPEGGWPATLEDVAAGIEHLAELGREGIDLDLDRVIVAGHSAGGHLALWAAGRSQSHERAQRRVRLQAAVGLAPIADLVRGHEANLGGGAVAKLMGGTPADCPQRYHAASPMEMLPLGVSQLILHGTEDDAVPIEHSRDYVRAAQAAGDPVEFIELPGAGHMEYLDSESEACAALSRWLLRILTSARR